VDSQLRSRLQRLNADLADYALDPGQAVWLACDLLVAGFDTPALCELAGESPTRLMQREASPLVERMLTELDVELMTEEQADWVFGREVAQRVLSGEPRDEWEDDIWRVTVRLANDDVYAALRNYEDEAGPVLDFLREYLRLAEAELTGS
jgi:hypothetical protein